MAFSRFQHFEGSVSDLHHEHPGPFMPQVALVVAVPQSPRVALPHTKAPGGRRLAYAQGRQRDGTCTRIRQAVARVSDEHS